ncbi:MAG: hypothetical protein MSC51_03820 [Mollicutes bacterium]|nr:hypothetical protein [Mollicutes bacterium]
MNNTDILNFLDNVSKNKAKLNNDPEFLLEYFDKACSLLNKLVYNCVITPRTLE